MIIGYVCTNYNNSALTVVAANSLLSGCKNGNVKIVVVDNTSDENNRNLLMTLQNSNDDVHVIFNDENIGYFKGINCGLEYLRSNYADIDYVVIGNNDLVFSENFCEAIQAKAAIFLKHAVISPNITTLDGLYQNPHVIHSISKLREVVYDIYYLNYYLAQLINKVAKITNKFTNRKDEEQHEVAQEIYQGHGSCYILGPVFFQNFKELWAPTFLMGEEFFLSVQLDEKGMKVFYEPSIKVVHHCNGAIGNMPKKQIWQYAREAHKLYRKHVSIY